MIVGFPPFYTGSNNNAKMYELIKKKAVYFPDPQRHNIPMSEDCKDFITKLLDKKYTSRLGSNGGLQEILSHPWFSDLDQSAMLMKELPAPAKPNLKSNDLFDVSNFDKQFTNEEAEVSVVPNAKMNKVKNKQDKFKDFWATVSWGKYFSDYF